MPTIKTSNANANAMCTFNGSGPVTLHATRTIDVQIGQSVPSSGFAVMLQPGQKNDAVFRSGSFFISPLFSRSGIQQLVPGERAFDDA